jgi:hypothetical protein
MDACSALDTAADYPRPGRKPKIAFVAEQVVPPVCDGSSYVYKNWIDFLAETCELYGIFFTSRPYDAATADRYLAARCAAHLILPGPPSRQTWKILRAGSRMATGALFAPRWIEELGRSPIHRKIGDFIDRHAIELLLVSKLSCVPLLGERTLRESNATLVLDMHDDFVARDKADRRVLATLTAAFPALKAYPLYRNMRLRHSLSRLSEPRARAQEARLCGLFDTVCPSSPEEFAFYRSQLQTTASCELIGWPPPRRQAAERADLSAPGAAYHAGFIGGDYPFNLEGIHFFCTRVLPSIQRRRPDFKLLIAGFVAEPLKLMAPRWPGVTFSGHLTELRQFYEQVAICVVPLLSGTGVSIKTLEALDFAKPVVSTRVGARGVASGRDHPLLHIAEEPEEFAARVVALCDEAAGPAGRVAQPEFPTAGGIDAGFRRTFEDFLARRRSGSGQP